MNFNNLLATDPSSYFLWIALGVILVLFVAYTFYSNKRRSKQMAEEKEKRDAIQPGYKITTIGGIIGTVVEIDHEGNTFVLETGVGDNKSTMTFDKQAIYTFSAPETAAPVTDDVFDANAETENNGETTDTAETETATESENVSAEETTATETENVTAEETGEKSE